MIVRTQSGTIYEFRRKVLDASDATGSESLDCGWEGKRYNSKRALQVPIEDWLPIQIFVQPEVGLAMRVQFEGKQYWTTSTVLSIEISDKERAAFK